MELSKSEARRLALYGQGLDGHWALPDGKEGAAQVIERLGYVQLDTISVIQRAHHHTLWTRRPDYVPELLHALLAEERRVFEGWTHAASVIPMQHYRYYLPRMRAARDRAQPWLEEHAELVTGVLDRIREEGPLRSADFKAPDGFKRGTWWSWKPAKRALETLLSTGDLMVSERHNFQRVYDLRERVLPEWVDTREPDPEALARFWVRGALATLGITALRFIWFRRGNQKTITQAVKAMVAEGEVVPVEIAGGEGKPHYALTATVSAVTGQAGEAADHRPLHILSPFDNLVIRRRWLEPIFDFAYRIECYMPAAKRRYGYFALPILWGERFVGRVDTKADRKTGTLIVRQLTFEPEVPDYDALLPVFADKLWAFAAFNDCKRIELERVEPEKIKANLATVLERKV